MDNPQYTEKVVKRYSDLKGELHLVTLSRGSFKSLGMSLVGNKDLSAMSIFVCTLKDNYPAAKSGKIFVGDELLEVNNRVLYGRSHLNATPIFNSISTDTITFVLLRSEDSLHKMALSSSFQPPSPPPRTIACETIIKRLPTLSTTSCVSMDLEGTPTTPSQTTPIYHSPNASPVTNTADSSPSLAPSTTPLLPSTTSSIQQTATKPPSNYSSKRVSTIALSKSTSPKFSTPSYTTTIIPVSPKHSPSSSPPTTAFLTTQLTLTTIVTVTAEMTTVKAATVSASKSTTTTTATATAAAAAAAAAATDVDDVHGTEFQEDGKKKPALLLDLSKIKQPPLLKQTNLEEDSVFTECDSNNNRTTHLLCTSITPGEPCLIELVADKKALGLKLVGGADTALSEVYVFEVYEEGAASTDGRLKVADQILEVNGRAAGVMKQSDLKALLRGAWSPLRLLVLRRGAEGGEDPAKEDISLYRDLRGRCLQQGVEVSVDMTKRPSKPLGLCVRPVWKDLGIMVHSIIASPGFLLEEKSVRVGDEVTQVNGLDVQFMPTQQALLLLKTLVGSFNLKVNRSEVGLLDSSRLPSTPSSASSATSPFLFSRKSRPPRSDRPPDMRRSTSLIRRAMPACLTGVVQ